MASTSTKPAATTSILTPVMTLKGHGDDIRSVSYFPDGRRMISGSLDKTTRQWDLQTGKEIGKAQDVSGQEVDVVAVSKDGRWIITAGGDDIPEVKVYEVETGIVKTFEGHSDQIACIDISADSRLLASGADDSTARVWSLDTGKLVAGPFKSDDKVGAVRFSQDSKKLAVKSNAAKCLELWDVRTQKLDVRVGGFASLRLPLMPSPVFWTTQNQNITTAFDTKDDSADTIYKFDGSTLETVGVPFEGHTGVITGLALSSSFDDAVLASASVDNTIKLWAFESRQLLASFSVRNPMCLIFSPDSRQLAYVTSYYKDDHNLKIYICDTPPNIITSSTRPVPDTKASTNAHKKSNLGGLLNSDATRRPSALRRNPLILPSPQIPPRTIDPQPPIFIRLSRILRFTSRTNAVPPVQPRNPLDVPATLPLPSSLSGQAPTRFDHFEISSPPHPSNGPVTQFLQQHLSFLVPRHSHGPPVVEVAPGRKFTRLVAANLPEYKKVDDTRRPSSQQPVVQQDVESSDVDSLPDVHWFKAFLCYNSCWSHGRLRVPPRWRLERVVIPRQDGTTNTSSSRSGAQHNPGS
ncbi:hypothetical protein DEU56DRAFT_984133 [Suillus clintonianus]|uniref:uncharacterized protein n=1 Tax=Suillus clintonianus TaxID=1904413 RepID=UPI001B86A567|nr:uncharacterized protein DEU56DRAFT_984133 [Suillus clintonianus]KAG2122239.1 hypothetical protein DEU56DRAFT_984133 [Suillus clintonianus]